MVTNPLPPPMPPYLLSVLLFLCSVTAVAQRAGKVTFTDGTTRAGVIKRDLTFRTQGRFTFADPAGVARTLGPADASEFRLDKSGRTFRAVSVAIPDPTRGGVRTQRARWAEVLLDGTFELLRVDLAGNEYEGKAEGTQPYLYLLRQDDVTLVLELTTILVYEILHANPSRFRNKLKFFVRDCPRVAEAAGRANFTDASVMRILTQYADCCGDEAVHVSKSHQPNSVRYRHGVVASYLDVRDPRYDNEQFGLTVGYEIEAAVTRRYQWFSVLASVEYAYQTFRFEDQSLISQSMVKGNLSLAASLLQRKNFGVQLTAGLSNYNALQSSLNSFFSNNYFLPGVGVRLRHDGALLRLSYERTPNRTDSHPTRILIVGAGYQF